MATIPAALSCARPRFYRADELNIHGATNFQLTNQFDKATAREVLVRAVDEILNNPVSELQEDLVRMEIQQMRYVHTGIRTVLRPAALI